MADLDQLPDFAISVRQPWAWAIVHGGKDVENRVKRAITLGGMDRLKRFAVHASTGMTRTEYEDARDFMLSIGVECPKPKELVRGGVIGWAAIIGVVKESESAWFFGPWALVLEDVVACEPVPCGGQLGAFRWKAAGELRAALPWMTAWPDRPARAHQAPPTEREADLFPTPAI